MVIPQYKDASNIFTGELIAKGHVILEHNNSYKCSQYVVRRVWELTKRADVAFRLLLLINNFLNNVNRDYTFHKIYPIGSEAPFLVIYLKDNHPTHYGIVEKEDITSLQVTSKLGNEGPLTKCHVYNDFLMDQYTDEEKGVLFITLPEIEAMLFADA